MMITSFKNLNKLKKTLLLTFIFIISISCGKNDETGNEGTRLFDSQIIIGSTDWKEISELSISNAIRRASSPVADVSLPSVQSRCTGFLVSEDVLMTNEHCITNASDAIGVTASFRHLKDVEESSWETYDCSTFLMNNVEHDFALLKCSGSPGLKFGFVSIDSSEQPSGKSIYVVQQNCDYYSSRNCDWTKKYSEGSIMDVSDEYTHNADTLGGSSGSPVFDRDSHKVVGLHHAGYGNNGMGRGYENYAVKMSEIVPVINARFPELLVNGVDTAKPGNNSLENALELSGENQSLLGLRVSGEGELDYYSIKANKDSDVSVKVNFSHSLGDLDVYLISSRGDVLKKVESSNDNETFSFKSTGYAVHFVVFGYNGSANTYSILVDVANSYVENDTFESAKKVSLSEEEYDLNQNEKDFFFFELSSAGTVVIEIAFSHSNGDLDLKVFDEDRKQVGSSSSTSDLETFSKYLSKGKYYIQVYGYRNVGNSYKLNIDK